MAFACAFTMFAGAADFTDKDSINEANLDAVDLLSTLKIIQGRDDGSFDPEGTVTRAEMAKMIYVIRNGGNDDASAYEAVSTSFTDLNQVDWAKGYIKYLQTTGIIAGRSDTIFDPAAQVTTVEAYKMALVLGGYRADKAELTGPKWVNNTVSLATTNRLDRNVKSAITSGCSRQDAAQILANALEMTAVKWDESLPDFVNDSDQGLATGGDKITVGNKWMDLTIFVGKMISSGDMVVYDRDNNYKTNSSAGKDKFKIDVETIDYDIYYPETKLYGKYDDEDFIREFKDNKDHTDLVGQEVKVLVGKNYDKVFGVYATGKSKVVEAVMCDAELVDKSEKIKIDGVKYDIKTGATRVYVDNDDVENVTDLFAPDGQTTQNVSDRIKLVDYDDNGKYETIIARTVSVAKITSVNSTSISLGPVGSRDREVGDDRRSLKNNATLEFDDNTIYEGAAKNDYAVVTRNLYSDGDYIVEKAEVVSGTVNGKVENERKVRVDGNWYTLANNKNKGKDGKFELRVITGGRESFEVNDAVTLYVVGNIAYYAESTAGNDKNRAILMVYNTYESTHSDWSNDRAKVLLANGDKLTVYLDDEQHGGTLANGGSYTKAKDLKKGQMYYYEVNNDGEYALYDIKKGTKTDAGYGDVGENKEGIVNNKVGGSPIADDAIVFVYVEDNDAKMYTGKAVKDAKKNDGWGKVTLGQTGQYLTEEENGFNYARILNVQIKEKDTLDNSTDYGYVITDPIRSRNSGGNWQVEYEYWNGSENVKAIEITDNINRLDYVKGSVISFAYVSTGGDVREIRDVKLAENQVHAAMLGANKTSVRLGSIAKGEETADVDSDTIIYYVDSDATPNTSIGITGRTDYDYTVGKTRDEKYYPCNVIYILDNDETDVKFMLIDIDNRLDGKEDIPVSALNAREVKSIDELIKSMADGYKSIEVDASVNKIDEKLDILDNVRVTFKAGSVTVDTTGELNIANSAMVSFDGDLVIQGQGKVIGDVNVADIGLSSNGTIDGSITVTNVLTNTVANLKGKEGSYITLNYDGKAIANSGLYAGAKNAAQVLPTPKKGTYMWTNDVDPIGSDPADEHWYTEDKTVVGSGAAPVDSMAGADIATLLGDDAYDTVTISDLGNVGATGTTDAVNVPKNKTLVMTSSATGVTAAKLQDITGTDATSKLVLNADISGITATDWFFGDAAVTLANATSFANMTFAKADGTAITGTVPGTYVWNTNKNAWMLTKPNDDELKITFGAGSTPDQKALNNAWNITKGTITVSQAINTHVDISANKSVTLTTMPIAGGELRGDGEVILEITGAVGSLVEIAVRNVSIHATSTGIDMADLDDINTAGYVSTVVIKQGTKINQSTNADSSAYDKSKVFFNDVGAGVPAQASLAADLTFNFDAASKTFKKA